jgi:hypothetical protein
LGHKRKFKRRKTERVYAIDSEIMKKTKLILTVETGAVVTLLDQEIEEMPEEIWK